MLGEVPEHGVLLLTWAAVCQLNADITADSSLVTLARKFGHRSVQLRAFHYLSSQISTEPFTGKTVCYHSPIVAATAVFYVSPSVCVSVCLYVCLCVCMSVCVWCNMLNKLISSTRDQYIHQFSK